MQLCVQYKWNRKSFTTQSTVTWYSISTAVFQALPKSEYVLTKDIPYLIAMGCLLGGFNTLKPRQNEQYFVDDIFKRIFFNKYVWISIKISLKFVPKGPINNIPALVYIMAWRRSGDKPLSEPMMVSLPTHICVTRPQWIKKNGYVTMAQHCIFIEEKSLFCGFIVILVFWPMN